VPCFSDLTCRARRPLGTSPLGFSDCGVATRSPGFRLDSVMHPTRPTPFELAFGKLAPTTFPAIRAALAQSGQDPRDRDAFLMLRDVVALLRELRPEEGLGESIDQLAALVHHAYLFWDSGSPSLEISREQLPRLLEHDGPWSGPASEHPACYIQLPLRRIWAEVVPGEPAEPLDGCSIHRPPAAGILRVLGVFGLHPERPGFSVVEISGARSGSLSRLDGSPLFSPVLTGGAAAGLHSVVGEEELLELGWRMLEFTSAPVEAGAWRA
jgi:hypothetical protein